jgi:hypothetical protein
MEDKNLVEYVYDAEGGDTTIVNGGGKWGSVAFTLPQNITFAVLLKLGELDAKGVAAEAGDRTLHLIAALLVAWTIKDRNGNVVPISAEALKRLPFEMIEPVIAYVNRPDFLAQMYRQQNQDK